MLQHQQQSLTQHAPSMELEPAYLHGLMKNGHLCKSFTQNGEPRDLAGSSKEEETTDYCVNPNILKAGHIQWNWP